MRQSSTCGTRPYCRWAGGPAGGHRAAWRAVDPAYAQQGGAGRLVGQSQDAGHPERRDAIGSRAEYERLGLRSWSVRFAPCRQAEGVTGRIGEDGAVVVVGLVLVLGRTQR